MQQNTVQQSQVRSAKSLPKAIAWIVFSAFSFAVMGMLAHLAGDIPFMQKAFFRNIIALFIALSILFKDRKPLVIPKGSMKYLWLRSIAGSLGIFGNFYAVDRIPIADAAILNKMSPFFAVVFSLILLKEKIKPLPLLCVIGAFIGSMFVVKPSIHLMDSFPAIFAFVGGMGAGLAYSCVRKLSGMKFNGTFIIVFFSAFTTVVTIPFIIINFTPMTWTQVLILIGTGVAAAGGQFGITNAYYNAPASEVSVYDYSQIIFSAALGFMVFGQIPDLWSFIGYGIIILMAVISFVYNNKKHREIIQPAVNEAVK